jgi:hypothetical protein
MTTLPEMRDLAQRLLHYEANAGNTSEPVESTTLRVYEKLRGNLCVLVGVAGFQALASRALTLARSEDSSLDAVRVAADGNLEGMSTIEPTASADKARIHDGGVVLISRLLGLLLMFLGKALTLNLVLNVWPGAALDDCNSGNGRKT